MALTRDDVRAAVERAGDEHWRALIAHHEEAYPASPPTPGEVCRSEAARLNDLGVGTAPDLELAETHVARVGAEVELTHFLRHRPTGVRLAMDPFRDYGP